MLPDFQLNFPLMNTSQFDKIYVILFGFFNDLFFEFWSGVLTIFKKSFLSKYEVKIYL